MEKNATSIDASDRKLVMERILYAPRELVWEVFTNPEHIKKWWGPNGFTNTIHKMEFREGGLWDFIMHGPDGMDYENKKVFMEIVKPERIVFNHIVTPKHTTTITLTEVGNKTLLRWHMLFESPEQFIEVVKTYGADEGLRQNVAKLENYLAQQVVARS